MAGASLLTLIDDIATILDDVSVMTQMAAKKTAGVLGDDLALNAQQVSGVNADRELPVIWAVAKGSMLNKLILVPSALAISAFLPWAVTILLMIGGLFLCFEGVEKIFHKLLHSKHANHQQHPTSPSEMIKGIDQVALATMEKEKITGAIRTDFVLSAEIIVITLGAVATATLTKQLMVLSAIAVVMTVGVYGLVAMIVKLDDGGLILIKSQGEHAWAALKRKLGLAILQLAPYLMKGLAIVGTAAMFLVGGAILTHGIPAVHHWVEHVAGSTSSGILQFILPLGLNGLFGVAAGIATLLLLNVLQKILKLVTRK